MSLKERAIFGVVVGAVGAACAGIGYIYRGAVESREQAKLKKANEELRTQISSLLATFKLEADKTTKIFAELFAANLSDDQIVALLKSHGLNDVQITRTLELVTSKRGVEARILILNIQSQARKAGAGVEVMR